MALSHAAATVAAADPAFLARVESALLVVAELVFNGHVSPYSQAQYDARAALASAASKAPRGYAKVFASHVAAGEWKPEGDDWVVPGAGDGTDPLLNTANGDAALRKGISYVWDVVAATPETVT